VKRVVGCGLVAAVLLVLVPGPASAAPHIHWGCSDDPNASLTIDFTPASVIRGITVSNDCTTMWGFFSVTTAAQDNSISFAVPPGAHRVLHRRALVHLGVWKATLAYGGGAGSRSGPLCGYMTT
jgi:hypothetical protein